MKLNFNPQILEKHVEKIVLAVAVLGAGWIAYSALRNPISVPDHPDVTASTVEENVTAAVRTLEAARARTKALPAAELTPRLQNYLAAYERVMLQHPLPQELVAVNIPRFAPLQESIGNITVDPDHIKTGIALAVPTVPQPQQVTAVSDRGSVLPPNAQVNASPMDTADEDQDQEQPAPAPTPTYYPGAAYPGAAPAAPTGPQPIDKTWVCVSGVFPMADFVNQLNNPQVPDNQKLPPESRRAVIVQIQVQRHSRSGDSWTDWKNVKPSAVGGPRIPAIQWDALNDLDLLTTVSNLDASFQRIVEPIFYLLSTPTGPQPIIPPILQPPPTTNPALAGGQQPNVPGQPPVQRPYQVPGQVPHMPPNLPPGFIPPGMARGGIPPGGFPPGFVPPGYHPPVYRPPVNTNNIDQDDEDQMDSGDTGASAVPNPGIPDPNTLKSQPNIPFWFFDDSVTPGKDYQYRVRVAMYNPTYRYPGPLKVPGAQKQPLIYSDWVTVMQPVSVSSDLYFFVNSPVGNGPVRKVDFRVYKWTAGNWYTTEWNKQIGEEVDGPLRLINIGPPIPLLTVDTHYRLVDVQTSQSGGEINAVLMTPNGELVTRNSRADSSNNAKRTDLQSKAVKPPRPKPPATRPFQRQIPGQDNNPDNIDQIDGQ